MATEKIKLSELRAARAAMPSCGDLGARPSRGLSGRTVIDADGYIMATALDGRDAAGVVATHNAADALIELAYADLAYRESRLVAAKAFARWSKACRVVVKGRSARRTRPYADEAALLAEIDRADRASATAKARLDAARERFEP